MKKIVFLMLCLLIGASSYAQQKKTVKKKTVKSYTTEQAIAYVEDYFNFYQADGLMIILKREKCQITPFI